MKKYQKVSKKLLLSLAVLLIVVSTFTAYFPINTALAATSYSGADLKTRTKMYLYANLIAACYSQGGQVETNPANVKAGQLFYGTGNLSSWYSTKSSIIKKEITSIGDSGWSGCGSNNGQLTKQALNAFGISALDLVCKMGYKRDGSGTTCKDSTATNFQAGGGIDDRANKFRAAIKSLTGLDVSNPGDDVLYYNYADVVINTCSTGKGTTSTSLGKNARYDLDSTDGKGSPPVMYYPANTIPKSSDIFENSSTNFKEGMNDATHAGGKEFSTCAQYLSAANSHFSGYQKAVLAAAAESTCTTLGYKNDSSGNLLDACIAGAKNQSSTTFCPTTYKGAELTACQAGQGANVTPTSGAPGGTNKDVPDCNPNIGIGWLLCPVVTFLANVSDTAKGFVDQAMAIDTLSLFSTSTKNGGNTSAYEAWKTMRNIANVLFIIAFLFMIYSQITGFGLSNYALKKMLPRLIVAAILINASFYICVAGVEISNVLGQGVDNLISAGKCADAACININVPNDVNVGGQIGQGFVGLATVALIAGAAYFFLPQVIAIIIYVAFIAMAAAILLGVRQALVILLVIASPIAFAAYLLPNTENLFKKWWGLFKALLLLYPIFGLLYGAGKLAAVVLGGSGNWNVQIFGYIALFSGLLMLPKLLEGALAVGGLASIVGKMQGKATNAATNKAKQAYDNSTFGNFRKYRQQKAAERRMAIKAGIYEGSNKNPLNWGRNARSAVARKTLPMYGSGYSADVQQRGAEAEDKIWDQKVGNQQKYMSQQSYTTAQLMDIVKSSKHTNEERAAAAGLIMKNGAMKDIQNLFDQTQTMGEGKTQSGIRKQMMQDMNRTPFGFGSGDISEMRLGHAAPAERDAAGNPVTNGNGENVPRENYDKAINARAESKISDAAWAKFDPDDKIRLRNMARDGQLSDKALQNLVNVTKAAEDNPNIEVNVETRGFGEEIRKYAATKGIVVQRTETPTTTGGSTGSTPSAGSRAEGPEIRLRGGESASDAGFIVPRDMK